MIKYTTAILLTIITFTTVGLSQNSSVEILKDDAGIYTLISSIGSGNIDLGQPSLSIELRNYETNDSDRKVRSAFKVSLPKGYLLLGDINLNITNSNTEEILHDFRESNAVVFVPEGLTEFSETYYTDMVLNPSQPLCTLLTANLILSSSLSSNTYTIELEQGLCEKEKT